VLVTGWINPILDSEAMKIILSPVKAGGRRGYLKNPLWMRRGVVGLKIMRKVQKLVIYKSVHKRGWNTRKLASKQII
jgi:hypothetical protein